MRRIWWFAIGGVIVLVAVVVALGFFFFGSSDGGSTGSEGCPPAPSTQSAGNAQINAQAIGKGVGNRTIVIHVADKQSGVPLHGAKVKIQGTMTCPHFMPFIEKSLPEASNGTYKGDYNLIMQGQWTLSIVVRSKQGEATTSALPLQVKPGN